MEKYICFRCRVYGVPSHDVSCRCRVYGVLSHGFAKFSKTESPVFFILRLVMYVCKRKSKTDLKKERNHQQFVCTHTNLMP